MSSTFSFNRFGKLVTKQLFENAKLYMFSVLALFCLLALVFTFWISATGPRYEEEATYFIFLFGLFIAGTVFASMSFNMLGSKDKGTYWLGVPATILEKLVCTILFSTILFTLVYCLCFYVVKTISVAFLQQYIKKHPGFTYTLMTDFTRGFGEAIRYFVYAYFAVQSLYLLGSVYFSRYSFIVTTVVSALCIFAFGYYISTIQDEMFGSVGWMLTAARKTDASVKDGYFLYSISPVMSNVLKYATQFAWAPLFWVVTWFRLKEKEI